MEEMVNLENQNEKPIKVYVKLNDNNEIVDVVSSIFLKNTEGWECVDAGYGDKFAHAQSQYLDDLIIKNGRFNFVYENGKVVKR